MARVAAARAEIALERGGVRGTELVGQITGLPLVDLDPAGRAIDVRWPNGVHATAAVVDTASLRIGSAIREQSLGDLPVVKSGDQFVVTVPGGHRLKHLTLGGLETQSRVRLRSEADVDGQTLRLSVSFPDPSGAFGPPLYTSPAVPAKGVFPPMFTGASYQNGVLTFAAPTPPASRIRLALVPRGFPEDARPQGGRLSSVSGTAAILPEDLELVDPQGTTLWAFPGELPPEAPVQDVDLRVGIAAALNAALGRGDPPDITFRLRSAVPAKARLAVTSARGALLRTFPGVLRTRLEGDPKPVEFGDALDGKPLADEAPTSVTADLTVRYDGLRILQTVSDRFPAPGREIGGRVVGEQPVTRALAPGALSGHDLAKVGLIGRAPEACELSVSLVDMSTGTAGAALGDPGVLELEPDVEIETRWVDVPEFEATSVPVGVSVRATRGRFFWVADPEPLLRVAVYDRDPGNRPLRLGGQELARIGKVEDHATAVSVRPAEAFRSRPPLFESELFLTVDLSDLVLRYSRP